MNGASNRIKPPLVSVLMPVFNRKKFINIAVDSVLEQTYENIELIVVDDGSSDGSFEILEDFERQGVLSLFVHEGRQNKGQSASLNLALRHATGELVAILDSDDYYSPNAISNLVGAISDDPVAGMVYGRGEVVNGEGISLGYHTLSSKHVELSCPDKLLLDCYIASPGGSLVKKSVYRAIGFFEESFRAAQDHDMALRIFENTEVRYIPETVFYYRKHDDSISVNGLEKRWRTGFEVLDRARKRYPYSRKTIRKRRAVLNFRLGLTLLKEKRFFNALPLLLLSGLLDPIRAVNVVLRKEKIH